MDIVFLEYTLMRSIKRAIINIKKNDNFVIFFLCFFCNQYLDSVVPHE